MTAVPSVDGTQRFAGGSGPSWTLSGDDTLTFDAELAVTTDGLTWPGEATVFHGEEGGRADGTVLEATEEHAFTSCWNADGNAVWLGGDETIRTEGQEADCPADPAAAG